MRTGREIGPRVRRRYPETSRFYDTAHSARTIDILFNKRVKSTKTLNVIRRNLVSLENALVAGNDEPRDARRGDSYVGSLRRKKCGEAEVTLLHRRYPPT